MSPADGRAAFAAAMPVSRETLARFDLYADLLTRWQRRINLVSPASLAELWRRHFLDSAQLLDLAPADARVWTDLGSGGGFPGLVLALLLVDRAAEGEIHLVESDARKAAFLREAIRLTGAPARLHVARAEAIEPWASDVVMARALAPLDRLLPLALPFLARGGRALFPKGRQWKSELTAVRDSWTVSAKAHPSRTDPEGRILVIERGERSAAGRA